MSPEVKEVADFLVAFLGVSGLGGVALAFFGWKKAEAEKPHIAPPTTGQNTLAQIGGMVMGQQTAQDIIDALRGISASHDRCTLAREADALATRKLLEEERAARRKLAEERHDDHRDMVDVLKTLSNTIGHVRLG